MAVVTERLAVVITGNAQDAVAAFQRTGRAARDTDTVVSRVTRNIGSSFGGFGPALAGAAAVIGPAGVIGAAVAGSGALFAGLGIAAVAGTDQVAGAFGSLKSKVVADTKAMATPIAPVLADIAQQTENAFSNLEPVIGDAFAAVAPQIQTVADGLLGFANNVVPAFGRSIRDGVPVVNALSDGIDNLGHGLAGFLGGLTSGTGGAAQGLHALFAGVSDLLPPLGKLIGSLGEAAGPLLTALVPAFQATATVISGVSTVVRDVGGALGGLEGPAGKAAVAIGLTVLAVKALRLAGSGVSGVFGGIASAARKVDAAAGSINQLGPRIAAAGVDGAGGVSKLAGAVRGVGAAVPVLGAALAAGGVALDLWAQHQATAKKDVQDLTEAILADGDAIGERTRAHVADQLEQSGALRAAQQLGISLSTVTDAALGNAAALAQVNRQLAPYQRSAALVASSGDTVTLATHNWSGQVHTLSDALGVQNKKVSEAAGAAKRQSGAAKESAISTTGQSTAASAAATAMSAAQLAADGLRTSLDLLNGQNISVTQSAVQFQTDLAGLQQSLKTNGTTLDIHTQKGRDNTTAFLAAARSAQDYAQSVVDQTGDQASANKILLDTRSQLVHVAEQSGLTKDAAQRLVDKYLSIPKSVKTAVIAETGGASKRIQDLVNKLNHLHNRTVSVNVRTIYENPGTSVRPSFGLVGHAGGGAVERGVPVLVGERRPEVFLPSTSGTIRPTAAGMGDGGSMKLDQATVWAIGREFAAALNGARFEFGQDGLIKVVSAGLAANIRR